MKYVFDKTTEAIITFLFVIVGIIPAAGQDYAPLEMGVNVNERPHWLKPELLEQSQTTWTRSFIEVSHYIKGNRQFGDDFRVEALKETANNGYKNLLSIKWNFKEAGWRVPEPGSEQEQQFFNFTKNLLQELDGYLSKLVLVNELTIDTPRKDLQPDDQGEIPFVRFQKRLLDFVSKLNPKTAEGKPLPLYTGGFTRLDQENMQNRPVIREMFKWINEEDRLAGADFHMHQPDYKTTIEAADFIRNHIPEKSLIVTEFSLVWKWKAHMSDEIGKTGRGAKFAEKYGVDPKMSVADYSTYAFTKPVTDAEWQDFLKSQPWFEPNYLTIMGRIMERRKVDLATYAFTQTPGSHEGWKVTERTSPWFIHQIFVPHLERTHSNQVPRVYGMFDSFVRWQQSTQVIQSSS